MKKPFVLVIRDGWGEASASSGNALSLAKTPISDSLKKKYPHCFLSASGLEVGLPEGQIGNSEVGHLNIGSGRIIKQNLVRINELFSQKELLQNHQGLLKFVKGMKRKRLHLMGLLSEGGVHSHQEHLFTLIPLFLNLGVEEILLHLFLDGRDSEILKGYASLCELEEHLSEKCRIATVMGRYWSMDRGRYWERTEKAWRAMASAEGEIFSTKASEVIQQLYVNGDSDEFIVPLVHSEYSGMQEGEGIFCFNFRSDRMRQICRTFLYPKEFDFVEEIRMQMMTITEYDSGYDCQVLIPPIQIQKCLGEVLSLSDLKQLRLAESEKYPHVTYFFNGGSELPFPQEERKIIPSPLVATYDLAPEMSAGKVTKHLLNHLQEYDVVILNYANPDMVGHTGELKAAIRAVEEVDRNLGSLVEKILTLGGELLVTADHGNCEEMINAEGNPHTAHTTNSVECVYVSKEKVSLRNGILADISPTILDILGIVQPEEMTGKSLLVRE